MAGPINLRKPFARLSDRIGVGGAIADISYLSSGEVTNSFLPPDGRRVYKSDYPDLSGKLREFNEGDTLNWVTMTAPGVIYGVPDSIAIAPEGTIYQITADTNLRIISPGSPATVQMVAGFAAATTGVAVVGDFICVALANGTFTVYNRKSYNASSQSFGTSIYSNTSAFSNDVMVTTMAERFFIIQYRGASNSYIWYFDATNISASDRAGQISLANVSSSGLIHGRSHTFGNFLVQSYQENNGNSYLVLCVLSPPTNGSNVPFILNSSRFATLGNVGNTRGFAHPNINGIVLANGGATLYKLGIGQNGQISQQVSSVDTGVSDGIYDMRYDEPSDTIVIVRGSSAQRMLRAKGKKAKFSDAASISLNLGDMEAITHPGAGTGVTYGLATRDGAFVGHNASSTLNRPIIRADDAAGRPAFNLPNISIANPVDRADGKSPYVRVK